MDIAGAREAIYQHFATRWVVGPDPRTDVTYGTDPFDPPDGPWVRVSVAHLSRRQVSMGGVGNRRYEASGLAFVQYFEPPGSGDATLSQHMDRAIEIFESARITGTTIRFEGDITPRELGLVENGKWNAASIQAQFVYEAVR